MKSYEHRRLSISQSPKPKVHKNFFLICLAKWRQEDLRKLARANGVSLRQLIQHGLIEIERQYREQVRLARLTGLPAFACQRFTEVNANN